ncbi:MAG TPA: MmgE/PrpD family protein [Chloroflexota bacterium]|nr:MmgE/PrpD family protein [Chloroflexota bacterium]
MTLIEELGEFAAGLRLGDAPPAAAATLRLHLFDTLTAGLIGMTTPEAQAARALLTDLGAGERAASGEGARPSAPLAALAGCIVTRCTEIDDIDLLSCTTPGAVVVPTALALAGQAGADADTFLAALLAGYEALTRFGQAADGPTILYRGIWPTYLAGALGAAATAARLLALSGQATAHALAAAVTLSSGTSGRVRGLSSRWLTLGCAAQNGILAALGARHGLRGDSSLLDGAWSATTGIALDGAALTRGLGRPFAIERVSIKPYCAAKQVTSSIAAFVALLDERVVEPTAVEQVIVAVPPAYARMIDQPAPPPERLGGIASAQHQLALAAYYRDELLDVRRPEQHREPAFRALMERVQVVADPRLASDYPRTWPARVTVRFAGGEATREVRHTAGDPGHPFTWDDALAKARRVLRGVATPAAVDRLATTCRELGAGAALSDLRAALAAAGGPGDDR